LAELRKENSVDIDKWIDMKKPKGVRQVPAPDGYYELFGRPVHKTKEVEVH
jgi:hypothetical protein